MWIFSISFITYKCNTHIYIESFLVPRFRGATSYCVVEDYYRGNSETNASEFQEYLQELSHSLLRYISNEYTHVNDPLSSIVDSESLTYGSMYAASLIIRHSRVKCVGINPVKVFSCSTGFRRDDILRKEHTTNVDKLGNCAEREGRMI